MFLINICMPNSSLIYIAGGITASLLCYTIITRWECITHNFVWLLNTVTQIPISVIEISKHHKFLKLHRELWHCTKGGLKLLKLALRFCHSFLYERLFYKKIHTTPRVKELMSERKHKDQMSKGGEVHILKTFQYCAP